jgi:hypothetical protein
LPESPSKESSACPPGELRFRLLSASSAEAGLTYGACGAVRHLRSESASDGGSSSSRCRLRFPMPQFLAVTASALDHLARHRRRAYSCASRWLETPCAFRLKEPNRDDVTSDALCRAAALTQELRLPPSLAPRPLHLAMNRARRLRRARIGARPACLRPRTRPHPGRLPSD